MYVLEIFIGPLLVSFVLETVAADLGLLAVFYLDAFFFTLLVLGIFNFEFEGVYSAN